MTKRTQHANYLRFAAIAREQGHKVFARKCLTLARSVRYCPYHNAFDAMPVLP